MKSYNKWYFFIYSNLLESLVITFFFAKNETIGEDICGHKRVGVLSRVKLKIFNFSLLGQRFFVRFLEELKKLPGSFLLSFFVFGSVLSTKLPKSAVISRQRQYS